MPVPSQIGGEIGYDDEVKRPRRNQRFATGTYVFLAGRIGLDRTHGHVVVAPRGHGLVPEQAPSHQTQGESDGDYDEHHVEDAVRLFTKGIEAHRVLTVHRSSLVASKPGSVWTMPWTTVEDQGPIRWLTISNPGRRNAVPTDGWVELSDRFTEFEASTSRVLVIIGDGEDFCAGADLDASRVRSRRVIDGHRRMKVVADAALALHRSSKPTVAAVDGVAVGAGMNLALGCDVVVASDRARFSEIFVRRGLTVDFGGTWLLPRIVGLQRAKELALSGRIVGADEALDLGLCLEVVAADELRASAAGVAERFLEGAPLAQGFAKQSLNSAWELSFAEALSWEGQSQAVCMTSEDFDEGVASFLEKRPPDFKGH